MDVHGSSRFALTAAMVVLLAGCWPAPGAGSDRRSHNPFEDVITVESVASIGEIWTADTGGQRVGAPVVSSDGVHAPAYHWSTDEAPALHTFAADDGATKWTFTPAAATSLFDISNSIVHDGKIVVGYGQLGAGGFWETIELDTAMGQSARDVGDGAVSGLRGSRLVTVAPFICCSGGVQYDEMGVLDLDGGTGWTGMLSFFTQSGKFDPATVGADAVFHSDVGLLSTEPADEPPQGNGVRRFGLEQPPDCMTHPEIDVYMPCPQWVAPIDGTHATAPVIGEDGSTLYVGTDAGTVYAVDGDSGAILWSAAVGAPVTDEPALANGALFVPTAGRGLVVVDADGCGAPTCSPIWKGMGGGTVTVQPAVAGGVVFVGGLHGAVSAFPADGCGSAICSPLWTTATGSRITGAPAVTGGRLYVGTADGRLIAFAPMS